MTDFTPLYDNVLLKRLEIQTVTPGGVLLPTEGAEKQQPYMEVLAIGCGGLLPDGKISLPRVAVGDKVVVNMAGCLPMKLTDGNLYFLTKEKDILGILDEKTK